jgi:SAM-dependent methyltransferase
MAHPPQIFDRRLIRQRRKRLSGKGPHFLLDIIWNELADRISMINRPLRTMLIHGPVSGILKSQARALRPDARILSSDILPQRNVDLVFDDEAQPIAPSSLEAFIQPLGLETANDVPGALAQIRRSLRPDGLLLAAVLGGDTLTELRQAWLMAESSIAGGATPRVAPFIHIRQWGELLQRADIALPVVDADRRTILYANLIALMRDLRAMGLSNSLIERSRRPLSRRLLSRLAETYADQFGTPDGRLPATFEILYLTGWAPHESQQQPLRPGSAARRLADFLKPGD